MSRPTVRPAKPARKRPDVAAPAAPADELTPVFDAVAAYFGLLALLSGGWRSLAARDRKARFRLLPLFGTALAAVVLFPVWPPTEPANIATAVSIAAVTLGQSHATTFADLAEAAAEGKKLAKSLPGNSYVRDGAIIIGDLPNSRSATTLGY